jgi:hypothetical protein
LLQAINIAGWTLKQKGGDAEVTYKFPPRTQIKPHQVLTVKIHFEPFLNVMTLTSKQQ